MGSAGLLADSALLRTLEEHTGKMVSVTVSPGGVTVRVWRVCGGALLHTLEEHTKIVYSVAVSPDGVTIVSGSTDKMVRVCHLADGALLHTLEVPVICSESRWYPTDNGGNERPACVTSGAVSPNGATIVNGSMVKTVLVWRVADGALLRKLALEEDTRSDDERNLFGSCTCALGGSEPWRCDDRERRWGQDGAGVTRGRRTRRFGGIG